MAGEFKDKFIAYIDVLGFTDMISAAESGQGRSLDQIDELLAELGSSKHREAFKNRGPKICPRSTYMERDLDFEIAQVSDCAILSAEVSPAGAINLLGHCWAAAVMLLTKGVLVRGYVTRGNIHHDEMVFRGTGYHEAYSKESQVSIFREEADEKGTPFIEVDSSVLTFVDHETDECVRKMFSRFVKRDSEVAAIFPFEGLSHSFVIGKAFDPELEKRNNDNVRKAINNLKGKLLEYVDPQNEGAMRKIRHYQKALDAQLGICDKTDDLIDRLSS